MPLHFLFSLSALIGLQWHCITCCLNRKVGLEKLETRPDPWIRCELLLVGTFFSSADLSAALKCSALRPKLGGQNKRLHKRKILPLVSKGLGPR